MDRRQLVCWIDQYINHHLSEPLSVEELALVLNYSKYHLLHEFSQYTKMSIYDYIKRRRLHLAGELLLNTSQAVVQVGLETGYQTQQSFTRAFSELYKVTPKQFRRASKEFGLIKPLSDAVSFDSGFETKPVFKQAELRDIDWILELMEHSRGAFPYWKEQDFLPALKKRINSQGVFIAVMNCCAAVLIYNWKTAVIEGLTAHPLFWSYDLEEALLNRFVKKKGLRNTEIRSSSFRQGDRLDIGYRNRLLAAGFQSIGPAVELGYPVEQFVLNNKV